MNSPNNLPLIILSQLHNWVTLFVSLYLSQIPPKNVSYWCHIRSKSPELQIDVNHQDKNIR